MFTELFWAYLVAITLLTITPGVDTLLVMRNTGRGGLRDGCVTSVGICSGLFIHATLSALGISILLVETAWAFSALKWAGACYLVWLGIASLRQAWSRNSRPKTEPREVVRRRVGTSVSFREGLLSNVLNPKTALFYMALLPQFVDPAGNAFQQSLVLASVHFLLAMVWQCGLAFAVVRFKGLGASARVKRALNAATGGFFVAMGAKLASS
ncbi:LysE family translocator [Marinobacter sp. M216]|uniref:LysE family translocator n=1 Tax=Marinobacter albus TaxID=3030833 RepID=A0ABT7HFD7_9GAMM|nr:MULTISPECIES: LysE family translocator [unclassified Marinobacter]MBW7472531.1 LysE family translocator [Marinobacter sp. F4218]MDK9559081.1 LysE family translocator [Marinobacter sp. M216]